MSEPVRLKVGLGFSGRRVGYEDDLHRWSHFSHHSSAMATFADSKQAKELNSDRASIEGSSVVRPNVAVIDTKTEIRWGKVSLRIEESGVFKTQNGRMIKTDSFMPFEEAFGEAFQAIYGEKTAGLSDLFISPAYAGTPTDVDKI